MKNYEKYKSEIDAMCESGKHFGLTNGEIRSCSNMSCDFCEFDDNCNNCRISLIKWLLAEYEEPPVDWSKVKVDTLILVRDSEDGKWMRRHFAKYVDGDVYVWGDGRSSWTTRSEFDVTDWKFAKLAEEEE